MEWVTTPSLGGLTRCVGRGFLTAIAACTPHVGPGCPGGLGLAGAAWRTQECPQLDCITWESQASDSLLVSSFGTPPNLGQRLLSDSLYGVAGLLPREDGRSLVEKAETRSKRNRNSYWKPLFSSLLLSLLLLGTCMELGLSTERLATSVCQTGSQDCHGEGRPQSRISAQQVSRAQSGPWK